MPGLITVCVYSLLLHCSTFQFIAVVRVVLLLLRLRNCGDVLGIHYSWQTVEYYNIRSRRSSGIKHMIFAGTL